MADRTRDEPLAQVRGFPAPAGPLDLDVRRGEVVHLRGGNGSGKTSLLRALAGLDAPLRPRQALVLGRDPRTMEAPELARAVRMLWPSPRAGLVGLTLEGEARMRGARPPPGLERLAGRDVATLSTGEARQAALAFLAASPAPLLLLDEPAAGLDPDGLAALDALLADAVRAGAAVVADHTGWAARHATRSVDLDAAQPEPVAALPQVPGPAALRCPPARVTLGRQALDLPGVALGPGLHAVTGRNGAGKSTFLRRLAGLSDAEGVTVAGAPPEPGRNVRLLLPDAGGLLLAESVRDELAGTHDADGLVPPGLLDRHPASLSAGEGQRVGLAKALGRPAPVHLLDEPDAHLDADGRRRLLRAIARRVAAGACVVAATHDAGFIAAAHGRIEVGA